MTITWTDTGAVITLARESLFSPRPTIVIDQLGAMIDGERLGLEATAHHVGRYLVIDTRTRQWTFRHGADPEQLQVFLDSFRRALDRAIATRGAGPNEVPEELKQIGTDRDGDRG